MPEPDAARRERSSIAFAPPVLSGRLQKIALSRSRPDLSVVRPTRISRSVRNYTVCCFVDTHSNPGRVLPATVDFSGTCTALENANHRTQHTMALPSGLCADELRNSLDNRRSI